MNVRGQRTNLLVKGVTAGYINTFVYWYAPTRYAHKSSHKLSGMLSTGSTFTWPKATVIEGKKLWKISSFFTKAWQQFEFLASVAIYLKHIQNLTQTTFTNTCFSFHSFCVVFFTIWKAHAENIFALQVALLF